MSVYTGLIDNAMRNLQQAKELFQQTFTDSEWYDVPEDWAIGKFDCALDCMEIVRELDEYRNFEEVDE